MLLFRRAELVKDLFLKISKQSWKFKYIFQLRKKIKVRFVRDSGLNLFIFVVNFDTPVYILIFLSVTNAVENGIQKTSILLRVTKVKKHARTKKVINISTTLFYDINTTNILLLKQQQIKHNLYSFHWLLCLNFFKQTTMVLSKTASESDVSVHSTFASRYVRTSFPRCVHVTFLIQTWCLYWYFYTLIDVGGFMYECCRFKMPENSTPKEAAYQIINDELMLDGNPRLNLASFVTTWMEPECDKLMMASINKNYVDMDEYPVTTELQVVLFSILLLLSIYYYLTFPCMYYFINISRSLLFDII